MRSCWILLLFVMTLSTVYAVESSWDFAGNNAAIWIDQENNALSNNVTNNAYYFTQVNTGSGAYSHFFTKENVTLAANNSWNVSAFYKRGPVVSNILCLLSVSNGSGYLENYTTGNNLCYVATSTNTTATVMGFRTDDTNRLFFRASRSGSQATCEMGSGSYGANVETYLRMRNLGNRTIIAESSSFADFSVINHTCISFFATNTSNQVMDHLHLGTTSMAVGIAPQLAILDNVFWGYNSTVVTPTPSNFSVSATGITNPLRYFNFTINGTSYTSSGAINVNTTLNFSVPALYTLEASSDGHYNLTFTNLNISGGVFILNFSQVQNVTVAAIEFYDNTSIAFFNATLWNSTYNLTLPSGGLSALFRDNNTLYNGTFNITVTAGDHFTNTISVQINGTHTNISVSMVQAYLTVEAYTLISNQQIFGFNASLPAQVNSTINGTATLAGKAGSFTLALRNGFWSNISTIILGNKTTQYFRMNLSYYQLNVTARDTGGNIITNFSINLTRISQDYTQNVIISTTSGVAQFYILNGTYNISIIANNFAFDDQIVQINSTTYFFQQNFTLFASNAFNISFYDEITKVLLNGTNITLDLISNVFANNYSTTNGTMMISLLFPESYTIRYQGLPNYPQRFYFFNLTNGSFNTLNLYLLAATSAENVTITIIDEATRPVENAYVTALRYNLATNSYLIQEIASSDINGEVTMLLQLSSEYYQFIVRYNNEIKLITSPDYVRTTTITLQIVLGEEVAAAFDNYLAVAYNVSFNPATNNFVYTYSDGNGLASSACLKIYTVLAGFSTLYNQSCPSGAAGTIVLGVAPTNGTTYRADASIVLDGEDTFLTSVYKTFTQSFPIGNENLFFLVLATLLFALIGFVSLVACLILTPGPLVLWSFLGWINIDVWAACILWAVSCIIAVIISKRD